MQSIAELCFYVVAVNTQICGQDSVLKIEGLEGVILTPLYNNISDCKKYFL